MPDTIEEQAKALASYLGDGWEPRVWGEDLPIEFEARKGCLSVYPQYDENGVEIYTAIIAAPGIIPTVQMATRRDPDARVAVTKIVAVLDAYIASLQRIREGL